MANLAAAVKAYRRAQAAVGAAQRSADERVRRARERATVRRVELAEAIVAAYRAGMRPVEIVKVTGYSRERVRSILRAGGIEPEI